MNILKAIALVTLFASQVFAATNNTCKVMSRAIVDGQLAETATELAGSPLELDTRGTVVTKNFANGRITVTCSSQKDLNWTGLFYACSIADATKGMATVASGNSLLNMIYVPVGEPMTYEVGCPGFMN